MSWWSASERAPTRGVNVGKNFELGCHPDVVSVGRQTVRYVAVLYLGWLEGLDHAVLFAHPPDPMVALDRHIGVELKETVSLTGRIIVLKGPAHPPRIEGPKSG